MYKRALRIFCVFSLCIALSACVTTGPLHVASGKGDLKAMEAALHTGADPNEPDSTIIDPWTAMGSAGGPPLHHAAWHCQSKAAALLITKGADVNARGDYDFTALHRAAFTDCVDVVRLLLEKGADINARDSLHGYRKGYTALEWAAVRGARRTVRVLVDNGADPEAAIFKIGDFGEPVGTSNKNGVQILSAFVQPDKRPGQTAKPKGTPEGTRSAIVSDLEDLPSAKAIPDKKAYAIVIGIENYRQKLPKADFAVSDAKLVREYLTKVMGYPEENVISLINEYAAKSDFEKYLERWLSNNVEKDATVFIYYSGHGAPNPKTFDAFLVPYDGDPSFIDQTGYSLKRMYDALGKLPAKEIIVVLDACFSGAGGRSVIAKGARPLVMNLPITALPKNMTVLSASSGEQISSTYDEKGHGLFTYFMLKGIKNEDVVMPDGSIKMADLFNYIKPQVERIARKKYNNEQTPQLIIPNKN